MRNEKRINTNSREFMDRVWAWIKGRYPEVSDLANDVKAAGGVEELIEGGSFDCYYRQAAESMANWFQCSDDDIWAYYKENGERLWEVYSAILAKNIRRTLKKSGLAD